MPDLMSLLQALRRRWLAALCFGGILAVVVGAVTFLAFPQSKYVSRAMLNVSSNLPRILFTTGETKIEFGTYQKSQLAMLKTRRVLKAALDDPKVRSLEIVRKQTEPLAWLEREIQADYVGEVMRIWMSGERPEDLPTIVNAVTNAYLREIVGVDTAERRKRYESLKEIYEGYQSKLQVERNVIDKLAQDLGTKDEKAVRVTQEMALERRGMMEKELLSIELELRRVEAELAAAGPSAEPDAPVEPARLAVEQAVDQDQAIATYKQRRAKLETTLRNARRIARSDSDPTVMTPEREIASIDKAIAKRAGDVRSRFLEDWQNRSASTGPITDGSLKNRVRVLRELKRMAEADVGLYKAESKTINKNSMDLELIRDRISHMEAISKRIGDEVEFLNVELNAPSRVVPNEMANAPRREIDRRQAMAGIAGLAAFMAATAAISLIEFRARRISSVEEVVGELEMRVMASLPRIPNRIGRPRRGMLSTAALTARDHALRETMIESVDSLCVHLIHLNRVDGTRVVMITSAVGGEGKTSLACGLSQSLARAGRKTLLIDADMRRPSTHITFDSVLSPGLSEILRGEVSLAQTPREVEPGLWLLTAGEGDSRALQALAHDRVGDLFEALKGEFDYIIIDTPPILPVADTLLIGQHVDAVICSILRDVSRFPRVRAAQEKLRALEIRVLGAVVAGTQCDPYSSSYRYRPGALSRN